jgi:hypothetical protein
LWLVKEIPEIGSDEIEGQKFDSDFEIEPGLGIALDVTDPDMQVGRGDLRKLTLLRLNLIL